MPTVFSGGDFSVPPKRCAPRCVQCSKKCPPGEGRRRGVYGLYWYCAPHGRALWYRVRKTIAKNPVLEECWARMPSFLGYCRPEAVGYRVSPPLPRHRHPPPRTRHHRAKKNVAVACSECSKAIAPKQQRYRGVRSSDVYCNSCGLRWRRFTAKLAAADRALRVLLADVPEAKKYLRGAARR